MVIEIDEQYIPEARVSSIRYDESKKRWCLRTVDGGVLYDSLTPAVNRTIANTTATRALVVYLNDGGEPFYEEYAIVGWQIAETIDGSVALRSLQPLFAQQHDEQCMDMAWCLYEGDRYWDPEDFGPTDREDAIRALVERLNLYKALREKKAKKVSPA